MQASWVQTVLAPLADQPVKAGITGQQLSFSAVCTDSRHVVPGALFVALRGERFDGHAFVARALAAGATGLVVQRETPVAPEADQVPCWRVPDTLQALRTLAAAWRRRFSLSVVAVAGSVGKSSTKEVLAALVRADGRCVLATRGSENGYLGLALTALRLRPQHEVAVIEIGIDAPGAMQEHLSWLQPQYAVLTPLGEEHLEALGSLEQVYREQCRLPHDVLARGGVAVLLGGDVELRHGFHRASGVRWCDWRSTAEAAQPKAHIRAATAGDLTGHYDPETHRLCLEGMGLDDLCLTPPGPGAHSALNLLLATCMARALGIPPAAITRGAAAVPPLAGRGEVHHLPRQVTLLFDAYNANPGSMRAALAWAAQQRRAAQAPAHMPQPAPEAAHDGPRRLWLVLGDMLELGAQSQALHRALVAAVLQAQPDAVLLVGTEMQALAAVLQTAHFAGQLRHVAATEVDGLAAHLATELQVGDVVLLKASRALRFERISAALPVALQATAMTTAAQSLVAAVPDGDASA
ncbi:MAG: UDP-N-acetylmuramoyl-tripeptide--D-alanyl-D-alanine ligase [Polyangiales bacterium]